MIKTIIFDIDNTMYSFRTGNQAGMAALCAYAEEQFGITEGEFLDTFKKGKKLAEDRVGADTAAIPVDPYAGDTGAHGETVVSPCFESVPLLLGRAACFGQAGAGAFGGNGGA